MKLYWILIVLGASLSPQTSWLLVGAQTKGSTGSARVEGIVKTRVPPRGPAPYALVKLFPDPAYLQRPDLIRSTRTDQFGVFLFENVVPGKYRAIAFLGARPENLQAEATIAAHVGTRVEVSENKSKTLTLYLYAAE
jgi:hypothetical protein